MAIIKKLVWCWRIAKGEKSIAQISYVYEVHGLSRGFNWV